MRKGRKNSYRKLKRSLEKRHKHMETYLKYFDDHRCLSQSEGSKCMWTHGINGVMREFLKGATRGSNVAMNTNHITCRHLELIYLLFCLLETALVFTSHNFHLIFHPSPLLSHFPLSHPLVAPFKNSLMMPSLQCVHIYLWIPWSIIHNCSLSL